MTATGNEAVSIAQLKDYADNQSAGGGGGYTYKYVSLSSSRESTFGNWVLEGLSGAGFSDPCIAICYNDSELVLESVIPKNISTKWKLTVTNNAGTVHCLLATASSGENYPMFIGAPYTDYGEGLNNAGTASVEIRKTENTLRVETTFSSSGHWFAMSPRLRFYVTED